MFAIMKSYICFLYEKKPVYSIVTDPLHEKKEISKTEARRIIREEGFISSFKNEDGEIWESPDKAWSTKYKGCFAREEAKQCERVKQRKLALMGLNTKSNEQITETNANTGPSSDAVAD